MMHPTQWDIRPARPTAISAPTVALASIWTAVAAISLFAPDLVSGSEQQHLPVAAFGTWMWGAFATFSALAALARLRDDGPTGLQLAARSAPSGRWPRLSIGAPSMVTGSDPTRLPIAALVAPVAAVVLTVGVCGFAATVTATRRRG